MVIKVGCCGFPISKNKYFENFKLVEIQQTFYRLLNESLLEKWRKEAPKDFEFTIKAFQGLTHSIRSFTWKRSGLSKEEMKKIEKFVGDLKVNKVTMEYWEKMLKYAKILNSKIILLQLPNSFKDSEENVKQAKEFFKNVENDNIKIALELRGWRKESKLKIFEEFDVIDVVDLSFEKPSIVKDVLYTRLHGKHEGHKIIYSYEYSKEELKRIKEEVMRYSTKESYVLFNNAYMLKNALEFISLL
ncbi:MAG: DUF72 domain-containing protein [Candidatus Aenigmatarchaeota archaeon]